MPDEAGLGEIESHIEPLLVSIGRAVLGAAALEKVLLVDVARRRADREGFAEELGRDLAELERRPAGHLLETLKRLDLDDELARRIEDLIVRRNQLVHHFMEDRDVLVAFATGEVQPLIDRVDQIALDCQTIVNELGPSAFSGLERLFGVSAAELFEAVRAIDPETIADKRLREQLELIQALDADQLRELQADES